jgi:hypothetical protein
MKERPLRNLLVSFVAMFALVASAPRAMAGTTWTVMPTTNPGEQTVSDIFFTAVSATSNTDVWAVGIDQIGATRFPLIEHWDGQRFRAVRVPRPANRQSWFNGVLALSPTNAWAVGESTDPQADNQDQRTLIEHWDGTSWTIVPSPNPFVDGFSGDVLTAIDGVGPNDIWATGWAFDEPNQQILMLFEHFDGTAWTAAQSPSPLGSTHFATAITAISPSNAWAVGHNALATTLAAHWNGRRWRIVPTPSLHDGIAPSNSLTGVTAVAANDVWASGYEANVDNQNFQMPYMLHWDGTAWTLVLTPNLGGEGSRLNATTALSANDVWAVGQTQDLNGRIFTFTEQFDGTAWNVVPSPSPGGSFPIDSLHGVASPGPGAVVTVGARTVIGQCCLRTLALATSNG